MATVAKDANTSTQTLGASGVGPYPVGFRIFDTDGIDVYLNGEKTTAFTLNASFAGGFDDAATITFDTSQSAGTVVRIERNLNPFRGADLTVSSTDLIGKLNNEFARIWACLADVHRDIRRAPRTLADIDMGAIDPKASALLRMNQAGTGFEAGPTVAEVILGLATDTDNYAIDTGSGDTVRLSFPNITNYVDGTNVRFRKSNSANTGATTVEINSLGSRPLYGPDGNPLSAGDLAAHSQHTIIYNDLTSSFVLQTIAQADLNTAATYADQVTAVGLPVGGTAHQILAKISAVDRDVNWIDALRYATEISSNEYASLNDLSPTNDPDWREHLFIGRISGTPPTDGWPGIVAGDFILSMSWGSSAAMQVGFKWNRSSDQSPLYFREKVANAWRDWVPIGERPLGHGQSLVFLNSSRSLNTIFTNGTGRTIEVFVRVASSGTGALQLVNPIGSVNGADLLSSSHIDRNSGGQSGSVRLIVPPNGEYQVKETTSPLPTITSWYELR